MPDELAAMRPNADTTNAFFGRATPDARERVPPRRVAILLLVELRETLQEIFVVDRLPDDGIQAIDSLVVGSVVE